MEYLVFVIILLIVIAAGYILSKPLISPPGKNTVQYYEDEPDPTATQEPGIAKPKD